MKKYLFLFLCLLTGGLVWFSWPEYGAGYSEEQRRLWNERLALYPVAWLVGCNISAKDLSLFPHWGRIDTWREVNKWSGTFEGVVSDLLEKRDAKQKALNEKLLTNRAFSGPEYEVKPVCHVDVSCLPLEGLTEKETAERVLTGDGDACLQMVRYLCRKSIWGVCELSWRERKEINKWLDRAVLLKRPGALFLKCFFQDECRDILSFSELGEKAQIRKARRRQTQSKNNLGYEEYLDCVKKGDYRLYAALACLCPYSAPPGEYRLMHDVLLQEAERGNVEAQRNLAALYFDSPLYKLEHFLFWEILHDDDRQKSEWQEYLKVFPFSWREHIVSKLVTFGIINAGKAPALQTYREAAMYAREAALQGDMTARYLWLRYGLRSVRKFSSAEWSDILAYDRQLFEAGYFSCLENEDSNIMKYTVLRLYYSAESWDRSRSGYGISRGRQILTPYRLSKVVKLNDAAETRRRLDVLELLGQTDYLLKNLIRGDSRMILFAATAEVQDCLLERLWKWADEGDLLAVCALADFYKRGIGHPVDPRRAYFLYGLVLSKEKAASRIYVSSSEGDGTSYFENDLTLNHIALLGMAELVLDYPEFPGRDEKDIHDRFLSFATPRLKSDYWHYYLGQFYERGIGCPVDRKKALNFYRNEKVQDKACRKAVERLTASEEKRETRSE